MKREWPDECPIVLISNEYHWELQEVDGLHGPVDITLAARALFTDRDYSVGQIAHIGIAYEAGIKPLTPAAAEMLAIARGRR